MKSDPRPVPRALVPPPLFVSGCLAPLGSQGLWAPPPCSRGASPGKGRGGQEAGLGAGLGAGRGKESGRVGPSWSGEEGCAERKLGSES